MLPQYDMRKVNYIGINQLREELDANHENLEVILRRKLTPWKLENEKRILLPLDDFTDNRGETKNIGRVISVTSGINTEFFVYQYLETLIDRDLNIQWYIKSPTERRQKMGLNEILEKLLVYNQFHAEWQVQLITH